MASKPVHRSLTPGAKLLPIELDMLAQATGQPRTQVDAWFGPGEPMTSVAPDEVKSRRFDYEFSTNYNPRPRSETHENAIDFYTLRRMSDPAQGGLDLLRLAIETCKDKMAGQKWNIVGRDGKDGGDNAKRVVDLLQEPDGLHDFGGWQRMILEDHYVLDHPAIYLKPTSLRSGSKGIFLPTSIAGETVKPITWIDGDVPFPPLPAYQRYLKGMAGPTYTLDEMIVRPYNPRAHRIYGMSPVEQSINIINLSLRRMLHQTEFYTDGTIPDALLAAPPGMNPDQVLDFQTAWDIVMTGQTATRRHGRWVPNGTVYQSTKEPDLTGAVDEWLGRIICWCFSLSPQALVKEQNRATAQTAKQTAQEEGIEPRKVWFKSLMDVVIRRCYGADDLQFSWRDEEITDPLVKAQVYQIALGGGGSKPWMTPDEVREMGYGLDPLTEEQNAVLSPPPPAPILPPGVNAPEGKPAAADESASQLPPVKKPDKPEAGTTAKAEGVQKKKRSLTPIDRNRPAVAKSVKAISGLMRRIFAAQKKAALAIAAGLGRQQLGKEELGKIQKATTPPPGTGAPFDTVLNAAALAKLQAELEQRLAEMAQDGVRESFDQLAEFMPVGKDELLAMLDQANERAVKWAAEHAADLVSGIEQTTRDGLSNLVQQALDEGQTNDELAEAIGEFTGFDDARADMIATTETAFADVQGNLAGWRESGVVEGKRWIVAQDSVCDICADMDGVAVGMDDSFDFDGEPIDGPPGHPNCRCDCIPEVMSQDEIDALPEE